MATRKSAAAETALPPIPISPTGNPSVVGVIVNDGIALAAAEHQSAENSRAASGARAEKSARAVAIITAAVGDPTLAIDDLRTVLLDQAIRKGTVSKITTVTQAVRDGKVDLKDIYSLNGGYDLATGRTRVLKAALLASGAPAPDEPEKVEVKVPIEFESADEAIEYIAKTFLKKIKDKDARWRESGRLISVFSDVMAKVAPTPNGDSSEADAWDEVID